MRVSLLVVLLAACATGKKRVSYRDPSTGFSIRHNENLDNKRGEIGPIHPAVLEYVLAAPEGPLAAYYDLVLSQREVPAAVQTDLRDLTPAATQLAGGRKPTGQHYARALARAVIPQINEALGHAPQRTGLALDGSIISTNPNASFGRTYEGTAALWWGAPVNLDAHLVLRDYERRYGETELRTVVYRYASLGLVAIRSSGTQRAFVWDVSAVPGAFDPAAPLTYDAVAKRALALHPYKEAP